MFGYVKIHKDELKIKEYNMFKAYYCGVCFAIKEKFGNFARTALSYDVTFLALLLSSLSEEKPKICQKKCISNPFKKRPVIACDDVLEYAAAVNVILTYYKIKDDLKDGFSPKASLFAPFTFPSSRKVKKLYKKVFASVGVKLSALTELEKARSGDVDRVSHVFAELLGELFSGCGGFSADTCRILYRMGYLLGRFIYILDAYDDLEDDRKKNRYNPFIYCDKMPEKEELKQSLTYTLSEISLSFELLNIHKNKPVLNNIIYMGLMDSLDGVFEKNETTEKQVSALADGKAEENE